MSDRDSGHPPRGSRGFAFQDGRRTAFAKISLPQVGANLCFGGNDGSTLFTTAREGLYAVETKATTANRWDCIN